MSTKMKKWWWVSRDATSECSHYVVHRKKPLKNHTIYARWYLFAVEYDLWEEQFGITLKPGECKRIENPFWKGATK